MTEILQDYFMHWKHEVFHPIDDIINDIVYLKYLKSQKASWFRRWRSRTRQVIQETTIYDSISILAKYRYMHTYFLILRNNTNLTKKSKVFRHQAIARVEFFLVKKCLRSLSIALKFWRVAANRRRKLKRISFKIMRKYYICFDVCKRIVRYKLDDAFHRWRRRARWADVIPLSRRLALRRLFRRFHQYRINHIQRLKSFEIAYQGLWLRQLHWWCESVNKRRSLSYRQALNHDISNNVYKFKIRKRGFDTLKRMASVRLLSPVLLHPCRHWLRRFIIYTKRINEQKLQQSICASKRVHIQLYSGLSILRKLQASRRIYSMQQQVMQGRGSLNDKRLKSKLSSLRFESPKATDIDDAMSNNLSKKASTNLNDAYSVYHRRKRSSQFFFRWRIHQLNRKTVAQRLSSKLSRTSITNQLKRRPFMKWLYYSQQARIHQINLHKAEATGHSKTAIGKWKWFYARRLCHKYSLQIHPMNSVKSSNQTAQNEYPVRNVRLCVRSVSRSLKVHTLIKVVNPMITSFILRSLDTLLNLAQNNQHFISHDKSMHWLVTIDKAMSKGMKRYLKKKLSEFSKAIQSFRIRNQLQKKDQHSIQTTHDSNRSFIPRSANEFRTVRDHYYRRRIEQYYLLWRLYHVKRKAYMKRNQYYLLQAYFVVWMRRHYACTSEDSLSSKLSFDRAVLRSSINLMKKGIRIWRQYCTHQQRLRYSLSIYSKNRRGSLLLGSLLRRVFAVWKYFHSHRIGHPKAIVLQRTRKKRLQFYFEAWETQFSSYQRSRRYFNRWIHWKRSMRRQWQIIQEHYKYRMEQLNYQSKSSNSALFNDIFMNQSLTVPSTLIDHRYGLMFRKRRHLRDFLDACILDTLVAQSNTYCESYGQFRLKGQLRRYYLQWLAYLTAAKRRCEALRLMYGQSAIFAAKYGVIRRKALQSKWLSPFSVRALYTAWFNLCRRRWDRLRFILRCYTGQNYLIRWKAALRRRLINKHLPKKENKSAKPSLIELRNESQSTTSRRKRSVFDIQNSLSAHERKAVPTNIVQNRNISSSSKSRSANSFSDVGHAENMNSVQKEGSIVNPKATSIGRVQKPFRGIIDSSQSKLSEIRSHRSASNDHMTSSLNSNPARLPRDHRLLLSESIDLTDDTVTGLPRDSMGNAVYDKNHMTQDRDNDNVSVDSLTAGSDAKDMSVSHRLSGSLMRRIQSSKPVRNDREMMSDKENSGLSADRSRRSTLSRKSSDIDRTVDTRSMEFSMNPTNQDDLPLLPIDRSISRQSKYRSTVDPRDRVEPTNSYVRIYESKRRSTGGMT